MTMNALIEWNTYTSNHTHRWHQRLSRGHAQPSYCKPNHSHIIIETHQNSWPTAAHSRHSAALYTHLEHKSALEVQCFGINSGNTCKALLCKADKQLCTATLLQVWNTGQDQQLFSSPKFCEHCSHACDMAAIPGVAHRVQPPSNGSGWLSQPIKFWNA